MFISDDDDDLDAPEDEWLNDGFTVSGAEQHPQPHPRPSISSIS